MFNPAKASEEIKKNYIGYIGTTFHFRDSKLQEVFLRRLEQDISNGPFVEIKDTFRSGKSIQGLIDENILSPFFSNLEKNKPVKYRRMLPLERPLYLHQEKAIKSIINGSNVVVSTGTGSGKTYCFLIPVINQLLREKEEGTLEDGVRAIFIYPMNALANDQIKSLREILMNFPDITFGVYNGGTENDEHAAINLYEAMYENEKYPELRKRLSNEKLSREDMKDKPPHILFTNYAMLEHMLFRPGDDGIFSNSQFKFVVLDEGHVYAGATGIETAFLIRRLKARINGNPQFIITSATLGDGSEDINKKVVAFAENLTGSAFETKNIINAERIDFVKPNAIVSYSGAFYSELAKSISEDDIFFSDILTKYNVSTCGSDNAEILYNLLSSSIEYIKLRRMGDLVLFEDIRKELRFHNDELVSFIALCAKARKEGRSLIDIRYHYFLKALDGCFLAFDEVDSLSLIRKKSSPLEKRMFEVAVCDDCGELALVGKTIDGKLERISNFDEYKELYQVESRFTRTDIDWQEDFGKNSSAKSQTTEYLLCKNCGAIVSIDEAHNNWCDCDNNNTVKIIRLEKESCAVCDGNVRRFNLGYESATGVLATALYEQIPEYTYHDVEDNNDKSNNPLLRTIAKNKVKEKTGSQFLVFSDSRQGAAKFACFLEDSYNEFLRRRGIWNVIDVEKSNHSGSIDFNEFRKLLENYYSTYKLFRDNNDPNATSSIVENRRNSWVALLNELYNSARRTSLISLGKLSFEYKGNTEGLVNSVSELYGVNTKDAKNLLEYLVFDVIVRNGAIITDKETDINDEDRKYLYFTSAQKMITESKNDDLKFTNPWLPTARQLLSGKTIFYRTNRLSHVKRVLNLDDEQAVLFLRNYWDYLISRENPCKLISKDGKGYTVTANSFAIRFGESVLIYKCRKCGNVTQFNLQNKCIHHPACNGDLEIMNGEEYVSKNYYAKLYKNSRISPLFIKEHTAQLDKKTALDYQQQFIRKEINALSCSTTFEMGVDVGDLETVFLRNIPPLPSNYAQRVGRAGRSIDSAAFALTYARLSSHDFTFFDQPNKMIKGVIYPPQFKLENEKIIRRHIYAVALSAYLHSMPDLYDGNRATKFINDKGYEHFLAWLKSKPGKLLYLLKKSFPDKKIQEIMGIDDYSWLTSFCGENGIFSMLVSEFESNVSYLEKEIDSALKARNTNLANMFQKKLERYTKNDLIDMLVRGNILPKYGFPVDSVELTQNISSSKNKSLNLTRDLAIAISEYAPSSEVVADGGLYTSRYIKKPIVNKKPLESFDASYIADCPKCKNINYRTMPIGQIGVECEICGNTLNNFNFKKSIEPRAGFIAEIDIKPVPLSSQEKKYRTEAIYIGDKGASSINKQEYDCGRVKVEIESTTNDSLVVKSTNAFYVCEKCGYTIADDEESKLKTYKDYKFGVSEIKNTTSKHEASFGKGKCDCKDLKRYFLHHEFKTDVAKITFNCNTSDENTMLSVMYALLSSFSNELSIERRDIKACLTYKYINGVMTHKIIVYDSVPGGAGHARRLADEKVWKLVLQSAYKLLETCGCEPSCYRCLRSYENQKIHEMLDRTLALSFLRNLI